MFRPAVDRSAFKDRVEAIRPSTPLLDCVRFRGGRAGLYSAVTPVRRRCPRAIAPVIVKGGAILRPSFRHRGAAPSGQHDSRRAFTERVVEAREPNRPQ